MPVNSYKKNERNVLKTCPPRIGVILIYGDSFYRFPHVFSPNYYEKYNGNRKDGLTSNAPIGFKMLTEKYITHDKSEQHVW